MQERRNPSANTLELRFLALTYWCVLFYKSHNVPVLVMYQFRRCHMGCIYTFVTWYVSHGCHYLPSTTASYNLGLLIRQSLWWKSMVGFRLLLNWWKIHLFCKKRLKRKVVYQLNGEETVWWIIYYWWGKWIKKRRTLCYDGYNFQMVYSLAQSLLQTIWLHVFLYLRVCNEAYCRFNLISTW